MVPEHYQKYPTFTSRELSIVLDFIQEAALLINNEQILAVNSRITELTAYTRKELNSQPLNQLLNISPDDLTRNHNINDDEILSNAYITTRYGTEIVVKIHSKILHDGIVLLIISPINHGTKKASEKSGISPEFSQILKLIRTLQINDPQTALLKSLDAGGQLLQTEVIALYIGNSQKPSLRRIAYSGRLKIFPQEIYPIDIEQFIKPSIWTDGSKSITTILHQEASAAGLSYLATCPVGELDSNVIVGILVAGGFQKIPPDYYLENLQLLSDSISAIIVKNALISNLNNTIQENKRSITVFKNLWNIAKEGFIKISPNKTITEINSPAKLTLGYQGIEMIGTDISAVIIGSEDFLPSIDLALQGITTPNMGIISLHRRDGSEFPALLGFYPIKYKDEILGVHISLQDKSDEEYYQGKIRQLQRQALLGEVTSIFAHEVRNPINNISTGLQLLAEETKGDDTCEDIITRIDQDCNRLDKLMDSVLTISRKGNYKFTILDIGDLLQSVVLPWISKNKRLNIETIVTIPSRSIHVLADMQALVQVFTNLITNAVQAMESMRGGTLAIKLSQYQENNEREIAQIDISDTGLGIPPEHESKIFEPFYSTKESGTGLGLPITKQIITAHKGNISLTSFPGGTIFHIKLPVHIIKERNE
jgi:PAS domain S-box-containing protein